MTPAAWHASEDAEELLCFAAPLIPREHLCLVLAELAEATVYYWYVCHPLDWRLAWAVATLRAWCFGHASNEELSLARDAVLEAAAVPPSGSHAERAARAAAISVTCCATVALQHAATPTTEPHDPDCMALPELIGGAAHFACLAAQHGFDGDEGRFRAVNAQLAALVRRFVVYPERSNDSWVGTPGLIYAGDAMLRLDGRKLGDAARREDFAQLSPARAVAFDQAQLSPEAERVLPSGHRERLAEERAAPKTRLSGCVMTPIVVAGRKVGTRISCYGHHHEEPAPAPEAPVVIERDDPHGLRLARRFIDQQGASASPTRREAQARASATHAYLMRKRVPVDGARLAELDREERKRRAAVVPDLDWAPGSRWLTGLIFAALCIAVFAPVEWGGYSTDSVTSFFLVAIAAAAALWMGLECLVGDAKEAEPQFFTPAFGAFVVVWLLGSLVVFVMGSGVRFVSEANDQASASAIERKARSVERDRKELEARPTEEVRLRLARNEAKLARLLPLSVTVEALLGVLSLSPFLLIFAYVIAYRLSHTAAWHAIPAGSPPQAPLWCSVVAAGFRPTASNLPLPAPDATGRR